MVGVTSDDQQWRRLGRELARLRAAAGFTQHRIAPLLHYGRSTVANVEVGRQRVPRRFWQRCDEVLATGGQLTAEFDRMRRTSATTSLSTGEDTPSGRRSLLPDAVRAAVLAPDPADMPATVALTRLRSIGAEVHRHYQRAEYDAAAALVPELMTTAASVTPGQGIGRRDADTAAACAHLAVSKLALKLGDAQLGWVAADRAHSRAVEADHPALRAVTLFAIGCALLATPGTATRQASSTTA